MRITAVPCSALFAACLVALPSTALAQKETETVNRTVPFPDRGTLRVDNFSGYVHVTGTGGREVVIKAVRRAERERLDRIKLDIHTEGSTVVIQANKQEGGKRERNNNVVDTELDIEVPASAALKLDCFSCEMDIKGVTGDQDLHTFSGDLTVSGARGALDIDSFSGNLDIDVTGAGSSPDVRGHTFSGDIRVRLADGAKGEVTFSSHSSDFDTDIPLVMHSSRRNKVSADLPGGSSGRGLNFDTFSGSVRILKAGR